MHKRLFYIAATCSFIATSVAPHAISCFAADNTSRYSESTIECASTAQPQSEAGERILFKPGQTLSVDTSTEDITPTYDVALAQRQVEAYADSPEASFILAVALTRTSRVEDALKEVQRARRLAEKQGGPVYFDKMINSYEKMLVSYPKENKVRYGLAWAYYMKAYLLSRQSRHVAAWKAANPQLLPVWEAYQKEHAPGGTIEGAEAVSTPLSGSTSQASASSQSAATAQRATASGVNTKNVVKALSGSPTEAAAALSTLVSAASGKKPALDNVPHIPGALEKVDPADVPQIKHYFELALGKIDEIVKREPGDVWSIVYGAHLRAEYTGNLNQAMATWKSAAAKYPNNPAPYFFLGEGYLKQGNLKESINSVSRAIALRALGN